MRLPGKVIRVLNATGLPWELVSGRRHYHLRLAGRMVSVLPHGSKSGDQRAIMNMTHDIKRLASKLKETESELHKTSLSNCDT